MRRVRLALLAAAGLSFAGPVAADTHPFSIDDMLAMQRVADPRVAPDGKRIAFTLSVTDLEANKRRTDLHLTDTSGAPPRRLTQHEASDTSPRWAPDGKTLYFLSSRSGSQQVWKLTLDGGEAERVTDEPLDVDALEVSPDGTQLLFSMAVFPGTSPADTEARRAAQAAQKGRGLLYDRLFVRHWDTWMDGTRNHLFVFPLPGGPARDLMPGLDADCPSKPWGGSEEFTVSPDGRRVVFAARDAGREEAWSTNFDLYEVPADARSGPVKLTSNPAWDTQPRFSPDGQTLAYLAMDRAGYEADRFHLVLRTLADGRERRLDLALGQGPRADRSPSEYLWSPDGKSIYWTADHLGQHPLCATEVATGKSRLIVSQGTTLGPQTAGADRLVFGMHSLLGPTELFSVPVRGGQPLALTRINAAAVAAARFGKPAPFRFVGAKGDSVYGYVVYPVDFDARAKYPVAFIVHGGPQGSMANDFHYRWNPQAYAGAGYAAVTIDFHGSTGYGQAFTDAINGDWGGAPYEDLMRGLDFLLATYPWMDGERVGALGASYGGYMINWIAGNTDRFRCLVSHDGTFNERMAYFDTEELWFPEWEHGGTPWSNPEAYTKHSPDLRVEHWKTPMLVVHGGKDYRVVDTQGISAFTALQRRGIPSQFLYFPDENHWVLKPQNSIQWHETVLAWLDRWCKSGR